MNDAPPGVPAEAEREDSAPEPIAPTPAAAVLWAAKLVSECREGTDRGPCSACLELLDVALDDLEVTRAPKIYLCFDVHRSFLLGRARHVFASAHRTGAAAARFARGRNHPVDVVELDLATFVHGRFEVSR